MSKYNSEFERYLVQELEIPLTAIDTYSKNEIFDKVLSYEGHGNYAGIAIRNWVKAIYGVDLEEMAIYQSEELLPPLEP